MSPEEVGAALVDAVDSPEVTASVSGGDRWARATVDVPPAAWVAAISAARTELGCDFFDWLSAVDELEQGYAIVAHVWSTTRKHGVLIRTRVAREAPALDTVVGIYPGAAWHERETSEMFGVDFPGHPNLVPLLLPPEFEGYPLRKDFVLAARVAKAWPGAKEPGESHVEGTARRQPMRPPGVPAPGEWGPNPTPPAPSDARPARRRAPSAPSAPPSSPSSPPDGPPASSPPDGPPASSPPDGPPASSPPDGPPASSPPDGPPASSPPDGPPASSDGA